MNMTLQTVTNQTDNNYNSTIPLILGVLSGIFLNDGDDNDDDDNLGAYKNKARLIDD